MEKLSIELPIQAWNVVMQALAHRPYAEVFEVIAEIKRQSGVAASKHNSVSAPEDSQLGAA